MFSVCPLSSYFHFHPFFRKYILILSSPSISEFIPISSYSFFTLPPSLFSVYLYYSHIFSSIISIFIFFVHLYPCLFLYSLPSILPLCNSIFPFFQLMFCSTFLRSCAIVFCLPPYFLPIFGSHLMKKGVHSYLSFKTSSFFSLPSSHPFLDSLFCPPLHVVSLLPPTSCCLAPTFAPVRIFSH